jgi:hypothetical protein
MRQLITNDIFAMSRILKKLEIKVDLNTDKSDEQWDEKLGVQLITKIAENAHLAQNEINSFIGGLAGISGEEFGKLPIKESLEIIKQFKELDGISDFFKRAGQSTK